ncbi:MAG: PorP/SprF family type IX secretion system membrane protein [Bacteroidota bacterium]
MKILNLEKWILFVIILFAYKANAQEKIPFNHYYLSPIFINSAYTGHTGFFELETNYRQQWTAIEGAPQTIRLSSQLPLGNHFALGLIVVNDQRAIFNTNQANLNLAYTIYPGKKKSTLHRLSFGLGFGGDITFINNDYIENPLDPALSGLSDQVFNPMANAGIAYQNNNLNIGISLPYMVKPEINNADGFRDSEFAPFQATTTSINYVLNINHEISFTPWLIYQTYNGEFNDGYFQASGFFNFRNTLWLGAGYHSFNGFTFNIGFKLINKIRAGYAYELSNDQASQLGQGSQELYLNFMSGKRDYLRELRPRNQELIVGDSTKELNDESVYSEEYRSNATSTEKYEIEMIEVRFEKELNSPDLQEPKYLLGFDERVGEVIDDAVGIYVVAGAFYSKENAENYIEMAAGFGYKLSIAFYNETSFYYAVALKTNDQKLALQKLESIKSLDILDFDESWILEIK